MTISITQIDQVFALQESLEGSRSKAAARVLDCIERNKSRWPIKPRQRGFSIDVTPSEARVVGSSLRRFVDACDPVKHWRAVEVALGLAEFVS